jgi:hypothetical protein
MQLPGQMMAALKIGELGLVNLATSSLMAAIRLQVMAKLCTKVVLWPCMEAATEMAKGCPLMSEPNSAVCVYEALPM